MPNDALDPGEDGSYPFWPRKPDGTEDPERMPRGTRRQRTPTGESVLIDITPRDNTGAEIVPPNLNGGTE